MHEEILEAIQHLKNADAKTTSNKAEARAELVQAINILNGLLGLPAVGPDPDPGGSDPDIDPGGRK